MYCTNCGKEVNERADVCLSCGFNPMSENNYCPECGIQVSSKQVVCLKCGIQLGDNKIYTTISSKFNNKTYEGLYRSADDKILSGLCGGLAHKLNIETKIIRIIAVFLLLVPFISWAVTICYLLSFFLHLYSTRL